MSKFRLLLYKTTHPFFKIYWKTFKPKTHGARGFILNGKSILLVKNINVNYWSLPGGKMNKGEVPEQCLFRELNEELDISISKTKYKLGEYTSDREGKQDTVHIFVVELTEPVFKKQWELQDAKWFQLSQLPEDLSPATFRRIKEFQNGSRDLISIW